MTIVGYAYEVDRASILVVELDVIMTEPAVFGVQIHKEGTRVLDLAQVPERQVLERAGQHLRAHRQNVLFLLPALLHFGEHLFAAFETVV